MASVVRIGIVGGAGRGQAFFSAVQDNPSAELVALCDLREDALRQTASSVGIDELYTDYEQMLDRARLDAVVVGTPMPLHVPQSVMALERDISVLSEVPAAVSIEQCRELVEAVRKSRGIYMMAENCCYMRDNVLVNHIARAGLLGEMYYGEGQYVHEIKGLNELTPWRRKWQTGINGNTYPTHSLGPVYQWFGEQRVVSVCCFGSGRHYTDFSGVPYEMEDTTTTACRMADGGLVELRLDMISNRPHITNYYSLQGNRGAYESARGFGDLPKIYLMDRHPDPVEWHDLQKLAEEFLPEKWLHQSEAARKSGHGGGDYMELLDFVDAVRGEIESPIGVHQALDMTLPGLVSQQSIAQGSVWLDVPDSRDW